MPSTYAHRRFGADVLQQLPAALQDQIGKNRALFDVGLHGPDLLFYYHAAKSNPVSALGNAMHEQPGRVFFERARGVVRQARTGTPRWPMPGFCVSFCVGQHLSPLCGGLHPPERGEPLRNRDRVRRHAAAPGRP